MSRDDTIDNLEDIAKNLDQRKPVFVDEHGQIHDAKMMKELAEDNDERPVTQMKPTTWYGSGVLKEFL